LFIICIGLITYAQYKISEENGNLSKIFLSLVTIIGILSWISLTQPLDRFDSWFEPMMIILTSLIVIQLIDLAFFAEPGEKFLSRFNIYSWIGLILFSGFLLYDTQKLIKNGISVSAQCNQGKHLECVNYPVESLSMFMDIVNLFSSTSNIANFS
jgi:FtsH-binding integral membrane protein